MDNQNLLLGPGRLACQMQRHLEHFLLLIDQHELRALIEHAQNRIRELSAGPQTTLLDPTHDIGPIAQRDELTNEAAQLTYLIPDEQRRPAEVFAVKTVR
jgi:hypothetical protein